MPGAPGRYLYEILGQELERNNFLRRLFYHTYVLREQTVVLFFNKGEAPEWIQPAARFLSPLSLYSSYVRTDRGVSHPYDWQYSSYRKRAQIDAQEAKQYKTSSQGDMWGYVKACLVQYGPRDRLLLMCRMPLALLRITHTRWWTDAWMLYIFLGLAAFSRRVSSGRRGASYSSSRQSITPARYNEGKLTLNHSAATGKKKCHNPSPPWRTVHMCTCIENQGWTNCIGRIRRIYAALHNPLPHL